MTFSPQEIFQNDGAVGTLASDPGTSGTTLTLTSGHGARFATITGTQRFRVRVMDAAATWAEGAVPPGEIMLVTIHGAASDTMTVVRGQEGTSGVAHAAGSIVTAVLTADAMADLQADLGAYADDKDALWFPSDCLAAPAWLPAIAGGSASVTSGAMQLCGGPGMVVRAGQTVRAAMFLSNAAATSPTHQWAVLAMPDEADLTQATILATSVDLTTAAWGTNTRKKFSFVSGDGGSGEWTATVDTPVYAGLVQVASTPATLRGAATNGNACPMTNPKWFGVASGSFTTPGAAPGAVTINDLSFVPVASLWSSAS